jgi:signal peptidase II
VLCLTRNPGAFLSFGSSLSGGVRFWALTVGVSVGLVALFAWLLASRSLTAAPSAGTALILGGGFSNLFDRLAHGGVVTDFLVLGIGRLRTGVFNLADLAISAGTVVLLIAARRGPRRSDERPVEGAGTPRIGPMSGPTSRPSRRSGA